MEKILPIPLKLNFTPNTSGCNGLIKPIWMTYHKHNFSKYRVFNTDNFKKDWTRVGTLKEENAF